MSHEVEFVIDPKTGEVSFEVKGIKGGGCTDIAKAFAVATGLNVSKDTPTPEYREHCSVVQGTKQRT